jgi:hypothetical protein
MHISFSSCSIEVLVYWQVMRMKLPDVFGISAKNDVALRVPAHEGVDWVYGVLIGFEVKPEIRDHHIIQSQMECLITAYNSYFPTLQVCLKLVFRN